jgi:hypothetical protein
MAIGTSLLLEKDEQVMFLRDVLRVLNPVNTQQ